ncbi:MAG: zinc transporter ZupT [Prochlorococcaceae cyanobacterium]
MDTLPALNQNVGFALLLTLAAGLSTGIGSLLGLLNRRFNPRILGLSLSFSAGVMLQVSFVEIFPKARSALSLVLGNQMGYGWTVVAFFGGIAVMAGLDQLLPSHGVVLPPADGRSTTVSNSPESRTLMRMGLFSALAIAIHNFPEGLATFVAALDNPKLGIGIALAIAIHNIPEGLAISAPIHYATGKRSVAFWLSFASGLAEPLGALLGYWLLLPVMGPLALGMIFASVGGVMVYICLDELLPAAQRYGSHHQMMAGVLAGMLVMSLSLVLLA